MKCPSQTEHGDLVERKPGTVEQAWCGQWFDCIRCASSVLLPSPELQTSLDVMRKVKP